MGGMINAHQILSESLEGRGRILGKPRRRKWDTVKDKLESMA
jgi:hypothetical protein